MNKFFEEEEFSRKERKKAGKLAAKRDRSKYKKTDLEKKEAKKVFKEGLKGRVLSISPEGISVQLGDLIYTCTLRGALKKEVTRAKNLVTVGDFVLFDRETLSIFHVEERQSVLSRQEHLRRHQKQLIAANIEQVLITVSVVKPPLKPALVDRYVIAAYKGNMQPVIIVNKIDLLKEKSGEAEDLHHFVATYQSLGIPLITVSAANGEGMDHLREVMRGKASVFAGQSGVGKSSLINEVTGLSLPVGEVVKKTLKGAHTTTTAHLIPLSFGGWCIDTPGIRSFGIWDLKREDLEAYFPEITSLSSACKFPNCTHTHEPECAIQQSVGKGEIPYMRFESYQKLFEELK